MESVYYAFNVRGRDYFTSFSDPYFCAKGTVLNYLERVTKK